MYIYTNFIDHARIFTQKHKIYARTHQPSRLTHSKTHLRTRRVRGVNQIGAGAWSDTCSIDVMPYESSRNIEFSEIQLGEVVGEGAFSVVYRGVFQGHAVAVKRLKVQYVEEQYAEEFRKVMFCV